MNNHQLILNPLKLLIVADRRETLQKSKQRRLIQAIRRMFQGGVVDSPNHSESYFATGNELGVDIRELYWSKCDKPSGSRKQLPPKFAAPLTVLKSCKRLLVIVLLDRTHEESLDFKEWLSALAKIAIRDTKLGHRIGLLPVSTETETRPSTIKHFDEVQRVPVSELGEHSSTAAHLAVLTISRAWSLVSGDPERRIKLFISHAKLDGLPAAQSIKSQLDSLRWLSNFYDARYILPGSLWKRVLERNVKESAMIILRTEAYDQRPWCLQEVDWADQFGAPAIVVDLRSQTLFPREALPIADIATVRIPDGNLMRILNATMQEAMRVMLFQASVKMLDEQGICPDDQTIACPRTSLTTLGLACQFTEKDRNAIKYVMIPNAFRETKRDTAERIVRSYFPAAQLCIPRDLAKPEREN